MNSTQELDKLHSIVIHQLEMRKGFTKITLLDYLTLCLFFGIFGGGFSQNFPNEILIGFLVGNIVSLIIFLYTRNKIKYFKSIELLYIKTKNTNKNIEDFQEILEIIKNILYILENKKWGYIGLGRLDQEIFLNQIHYFLLIQKNLKNDLNIRIGAQKKFLSHKKSELEKNINGTAEILAVSEAQKLRLDRQIEQFEELEKKLVRI